MDTSNCSVSASQTRAVPSNAPSPTNRPSSLSATLNQYIHPQPADGETLNPIEAICRGWDRHVRFGLANPRFYALLYGDVERGRLCAITSPALAQLTELLAAAARLGQLRVGPEDAAAQLLAANVGVTLSLSAQPEEATDLRLSDRVREATLAGILAEHGPTNGTSPTGARAAAALVLAATLDDAADLTAGERALMRELLNRLADASEAS